MNKITIRPSSLKGFFDCAYRWYRDYISDKPIRSVGFSAHFGSGVHKASEIYYKECIKHGSWVRPSQELKSVAIDEFRKKCKEQEPRDLDKSKIDEIEKNLAGSSFQYVSKTEQLNFGKIPLAVEKDYEVKINSTIIDSVKGTLDIVGSDYVADIKTMSKLRNPKDYIIQQGVYAFLRQKSGEAVKDLRIHRILLSKNSIDNVSIIDNLDNPFTPIDAVIEKSKSFLELAIKTVNEFEKTGNELLFRGNPESLLCNSKYCAYYAECKFKKGF